MARPPALTKVQKRRLKDLRNQLDMACSVGDTAGGKIIVNELRVLLTRTGHHTKYYEILLHFSEMLLLKNEFESANRLLMRVATKTSDNTRLNQEANLLLSICRLHTNDLSASEVFLRKSLNSRAIKDVYRRKEFLKYVSRRFEEEALIVSFGTQVQEFNVDEIIEDIQKKFMENLSEEELLTEIGRSIPPSSVDFSKRIHEMAKRQLSYSEQKMLPPPSTPSDLHELGERAFSGISRRIWIKLCPPDCKVQKALNEIQDFTTFSKQVLDEIKELNFKMMPVLACFATIIFKKTLNGYCNKCKPGAVMKKRYKR